ncbi:diacylglycerol O-acyltransferase [Fusarium subglutinans]|uniref:diacylglycerol O-acyltransferase n=1 Tax=Gibberella subglutinans TaxID=42677 RepID=A0A8H5QDQ2_GIBSU|nr:diacylglycerol O-acyltransferase [Fusarium subglutinans]KAF5613961.1 diacylglycerol O-acyltransferase [Fusarium subglutinans]
MNSATATSIETSNGSASVSRRSGHDVTQNEPNNRTNGNGNGTATTKTPKKPGQKYRHVAAVHKQTRPSCLSHDSDAAPSFIGFRNLMVIVLDIYLGLLLYFLIPCHLLAAYLIELAAAQQARGSLKRVNDSPSGGPSEQERKRFHKTWVVVAWAHLFNITLALVLTTWVVYFKIHHPLIGTVTEMHAIVVWLKTASYAFTNRDLRHAYLHPVEGERELVPELYTQCPYPQNITFSNLVYFWWAPTLVYQPVYPRTDKIRWVFVAKRVGEIFGLSVFMWVASAQYAAPVLRNSLDKIASLDLMSILERLLKLSTISLVIWLAGFFALFQSFLNVLAEVLRFGDRSFYDDWWNSESLGAYWRTWNKPVYTYFKRHLYMPMIGRGWSPQAASFVVFLVSAILHEILVGVPTHNIIGVAFLGMFLQLPLIALTKPLENMKLGHTGKIVALMYFYAWQAKYGSVSKQMTTVSS